MLCEISVLKLIFKPFDVTYLVEKKSFSKHFYGDLDLVAPKSRAYIQGGAKVGIQLYHISEISGTLNRSESNIS